MPECVFENLRKRLRIFRYYIASKDQYSYVGLENLLRSLLSPSRQSIAEGYISSIEETDEYVILQLKGLRRPLFWPRDLSRRHLYTCIAEILNKHDWHHYEIPETTVERGDIVVDCGASGGLFGLTVLERARELYLIEPLPLFKKALLRTFEGSEKCQIIDCALSDKPGKAHFTNASITSRISSTGDVDVNVDTVDRLFFHRGIQVTYIKADLEGFEMNMLRGAQKTIQENRPRIAITAYHEEQEVDEMVSFMLSLVPTYHYKFKGIDDETGKPIMVHFWI
jgi:FkbM family methyltransferase